MSVFLTSMIPTVGVASAIRIGITSLLSHITTSEHSHKGGWARLLACDLRNTYTASSATVLHKTDFLELYDAIIFDMGAEFSGSLNMFGGVNDDVLGRLEQLAAYRGQLYSWNHPLPRLQESLRGRESVKSTSSKAKKAIKNGILREVDKRLKKCKVFNHVSQKRSLLVCDSHGPAVWTPDYSIHRTDGLTLHRLLQDGNLYDCIKEYTGGLMHDVDEVVVHASSIDVRHHLCRRDAPCHAVAKLANELVKQLDEMSWLKHKVVVHSMGIESPTRKLPKTGYYKGTPFFGTFYERNAVRHEFNSRIEGVASEPGRKDLSVLKYPDYFFKAGCELSFDVMERPQSVHISPAHYRWDLDNNTTRWGY